MTDDPDTNTAVNPALWAEFQEISKRVHQLANWDERQDGPKPRPHRFMVELEEEWIVLFAWMAQRRRQWLKGGTGPTMLTPQTIEEIGTKRTGRGVVERYLPWLLNEEFNSQLHALCIGNHYLWSNLDMKAEAARKAEIEASLAKFRHTGNTDDLPF